MWKINFFYIPKTCSPYSYPISFYPPPKIVNCAKNNSTVKSNYLSRFLRDNIYRNIHCRVGYAIATITEVFNSSNFVWIFFWTQVSAFNRTKLLCTDKWHANQTNFISFCGLSVTSCKHEHQIMAVKKPETSDPRDKNKPWTIIKNIPVSSNVTLYPLCISCCFARWEYRDFL